MRLRILAMALALCLCLGACSGKEGASSPGSTTEPSAVSAEGSDFSFGLTDSEAAELFCSAMEEIGDLAFEDPVLTLQTIFPDAEIYEEEVWIDGTPYVKTSLPFERISEYYGSIFTGDALEWVLSTKYAKIDGTLYCSPVGGMTNPGFRFVSVRRTEGRTYTGIYQTALSEEKRSVHFTCEKVDAGYRISDIDYRPAVLGEKFP